MTKKTITEQVDTPGVLMDAYGNPSLVTAGEIIESAWGNAVSSRVVYRYPNIAAINAASLPAGTLAVALDTGVYWMREASAWKPTVIGNRLSFRCVGPGGGVAVGAGTLSTVAWSVAFDPFGVIGGSSTLTVPNGWAGRWMFEWAVEFPDGGQTGQRLAFCETNIGRLGETNTVAMEGGVRMSGAGSAMLAGGQFARITMYHTDTTSPLMCNGTGNQYFQGYYAGPY